VKNQPSTKTIFNVSVKETAKLLGVVPVSIHRMLGDGRLQGTKDGRLVRVFLWSLEQYLMKNTTETENQDTNEPASKPKRSVKSTSYHVALRQLKEFGL
jgi:excisionase family DNA binding protein